MMGNLVRVVGPPTLIPGGIATLWRGRCSTTWRKASQGADIVMMLRLQKERMTGGLVPSSREFFASYGLDRKKLAYAKPDALVMHPGPMNRGVEIDSEVADDPRAQRDPGAGGDGRRRAHGGARHAGARIKP